MAIGVDAKDHREREYGCDDVFVERWSPRAMSGETIDTAELMTLFEAARWAPSSFNGQPWRFVYALRGTAIWETFLDLLVEPNRVWAKNAAALVVVVSRTTFEHNGKPAPTHTFDAGAAWQNLALQGSMRSLVVHGIQGFDYDRAAGVIGLPDEHRVEAMVAIGRPGRREDLPPALQEKERPSGRKRLAEIAFEGKLPG